MPYILKIFLNPKKILEFTLQLQNKRVKQKCHFKSTTFGSYSWDSLRNVVQPTKMLFLSDLMNIQYWNEFSLFAHSTIHSERRFPLELLGISVFVSECSTWIIRWKIVSSRFSSEALNQVWKEAKNLKDIILRDNIH